jgi:hemerythrin-like metal-binding protein
MELMAWSDQFVTGLETVDTQHHALVDLVNAAAPYLALTGEAGVRAAGPFLEKLFHYAATHFRDEEELMRKEGLAPEYLEQHHRTHVAFVDEVTQMKRQTEQDDNVSGNHLLRFLASWLTFHILSEDKKMAVQVRAIRSGTSPAQAQRDVEAGESAPHAVYTNALIDLFTLLTERNRTLVEANQKVQLAQTELAAANQSLELRVEERTRALEQAQGQLLQSEKMAAVGQLAAGVAHEINNPIGFISSNLSSLTSYVEQLFGLISAYEQVTATPNPAIEAARAEVDIEFLRQDIPDLLKESSDGLARVKRIVNGLRDFSHVDDGQWLEADLNQVLESALNMVWNEVKYKAEVVKELTPLPQLLCIAAQLNQVFVNLLMNAAQAIDVKGVITLRSGEADDHVWVEIADTGRGMTAEVQKRIFEPFYTTKAVGKGTGLGLSISWEIITRHHGRIDVHSEPGVGTRFRITLPRVMPTTDGAPT